MWRFLTPVVEAAVVSGRLPRPVVNAAFAAAASAARVLVPDLPLDRASRRAVRTIRPGEGCREVPDPSHLVSAGGLAVTLAALCTLKLGLRRLRSNFGCFSKWFCFSYMTTRMTVYVRK